MIESHASMHCVQWMHSICSPSRMSMPVGQVTTQAPQSMQSPACRSAPPRPPDRPGLPARLAAARVVADDERAPVEQHGLEAAVRAGHHADLLAEPAEVEEHQRGGAGHHEEGGRVLERASAVIQWASALDAHEVREEGVGEEHAERDEDART